MTLSIADTAATFEEDDSLINIPIMSKNELQKVALSSGGYSTPSLNDTLYLHNKGYQRIENLDEYTNLKALWLNGNGLTNIENLSHLSELRCLFLQQNALTTTENLNGLTSLVQLDLSENNLRTVTGLAHLPNLTTLNLANNALSDVSSISHLKECKTLSSLDLSKNHLGGQDTIGCLAGIEKLTSLNMEGNPVTNKTSYFRKKMIVACKSLRYLDRPIFDNEREVAESWAKGGLELERETKEKLRLAKKENDKLALSEFRTWQESVRSTSGSTLKPRYEVSTTEEEEEEPPSLQFSESSPRSDASFMTCKEYETLEETPFVEVLEDETKESPPDIKDYSNLAINDTVSFEPETVVEEPEKEDVADMSKKKEEIGIVEEEVVEVPKDEAVAVLDIVKESDNEKENIKPTSEEDTARKNEAAAIEASSRRINESLSIMKNNNQQQNTAKMKLSSAITMGWTSDMESKLMRLASEFNFDFERVAQSLGEEHGSKHIAFDKESCFRRWSLLDLSAEEEEVVVVEEKKDEFECSQTDKVCLVTCGFFVHMICTYLLTSLSLSTFPCLGTGILRNFQRRKEGLDGSRPYFFIRFRYCPSQS